MRTLALTIAIVCTSLYSLHGQYSEVSPDGIGSYWAINGARVIKMDGTGKQLANYSSIQLGFPNSVDATDPFRVLVFYYESQTIVLLNNDATPIANPVSLSANNVGNITLVCRAARGGVWLLHHQAGELIHLNSRMTPSGQRIILNREIFHTPPTHMIDAGGAIYLGLEGKRIAIIDEYGTPMTPINVNYSTKSGFRLHPPHLYTTDSGKVRRYNLMAIEIPPKLFQCPCPTLPFEVKGELKCYGTKGIVGCTTGIE